MYDVLNNLFVWFYFAFFFLVQLMPEFKRTPLLVNLIDHCTYYYRFQLACIGPYCRARSPCALVRAIIVCAVWGSMGHHTTNGYIEQVPVVLHASYIFRI